MWWHLDWIFTAGREILEEVVISAETADGMVQYMQLPHDKVYMHDTIRFWFPPRQRGYLNVYFLGHFSSTGTWNLFIYHRWSIISPHTTFTYYEPYEPYEPYVLIGRNSNSMRIRKLSIKWKHFRNLLLEESPETGRRVSILSVNRKSHETQQAMSNSRRPCIT